MGIMIAGSVDNQMLVCCDWQNTGQREIQDQVCPFLDFCLELTLAARIHPRLPLSQVQRPVLWEAAVARTSFALRNAHLNSGQDLLKSAVQNVALAQGTPLPLKYHCWCAQRVFTVSPLTWDTRSSGGNEPFSSSE